jgi:hypothetical protein
MRIYSKPTNLLLSEIAVALPPSIAHQVIRSGKGEILSIPWFPECKHGVLVYDSVSDKWEQAEPSMEEENLMIDIFEDGSLIIRPGDEYSVYLSSTIQSYAELIELMEFYERTSVGKINPVKLSQTPLSSVVDKIFLLVHGQYISSSSLFELKGEYIELMPDKLVLFLHAYFTKDYTVCHYASEYYDLNEFFIDNQIELPLLESGSLERGDLVLDSTMGWRTAGEVFQEVDSEFGYAPCLAIRLKDAFSKSYFSDFARLTPEGEEMTTKLLSGWKTIRKTLREVFITAPSNKVDQVAASVSLRNARKSYIDTVNSLSNLKESLEDIAHTYRKRAVATNLLHGDFLEDAVAIGRPLPFFIEFPYRQFRKQDDVLEKVKSGQRLLTILSKVPLYLLIEELKSANHPVGEQLLNRVNERAASDGVLVELQKYAVKLIKESGFQLTVFSKLTDLVSNNSLLDRMVESRNRLHHEPFDHEGFIDSMMAYSSEYIPLMRRALDGICFFVPRCMEFFEGQKIVVGEDISSSDSIFRTKKWKVNLPMESFPTNSLVAYSISGQAVIPLGTLITYKIIDHKVMDFGVFDRNAGGQPIFVFLRN